MFAVFPAPYVAAAAAQPASFVFNGTDEALTRTLSTSGASTTIFTYSFWVKVTAYESNLCQLFQVINAPTDSEFLFSQIRSSGDAISMGQNSGAVDWNEATGALTPDISTGTWEHWVIRYDSTQGTEADRIRMYRNGAVVTTAGEGAGSPALNEQHRLFADGWQHQIAAHLDVSAFGNMKLAFIDVLEGVSADPTAFAFDDGGTWTRMPYAGSYGTYGFNLDGADGFNDVSGNGQNFTGVNMDASNLDTADLPFFTM